ncbi:ABC transporter substrate-binding protein [Arthrobacter monumenti]
MTGPVTRRQLLGYGLGAAVMASIAGCGTPGSTSINAAPTIPQAGKKVTLTYWSWLKNLQKVADIWNAKNPDVQVQTVWIPASNDGGYQKIFSALAAQSGPDLAQIEMRTLPEFILVNGLVDLARYGANDYAGRYDPTLWNQVSFNDGVYGIPQDSGPVGFYYQTELLDQVGAKPPETWGDWAQLAAELRRAKVYLDCFPLSDPSIFTAYAIQAGATWLKTTDDGWTIDMTGDATMRVARFFDNALKKDLVTTAYEPFSPAWFSSAANGKLASITSASWADALIQGVSGAEGKWRVADMPRWGKQGYGSTQIGGSTAAVLANSQHPYEALQFATWMTTSQEGIDAMIEHSGIGWSPTPDVIGTSRLGPSEFFGGQSYNEEVFAPAAKQQNPDWNWWPLTQQSFNILSDEFRKQASGGTLVDAVAGAEGKIMDAFKNKGLSIRKADHS